MDIKCYYLNENFTDYVGEKGIASVNGEYLNI